VWPIGGGLLALLGGLLLIGLAALATVAVTIWAVVDACRHEEVAWRRIGHSRPLWIVLLLGAWLVTGIAGVVLALVYLGAVRPRLLAAAREQPRRRRTAVPPEHVRLALRASDADRDRVSGWLRHHYSVGRLTYEELLQRLDEAYAARTVGDLERSLRELPQS
jgi:hypothetical protein